MAKLSAVLLSTTVKPEPLGFPYLQQQGYTQRWKVETFFSALKRTMGSTLSARRPDQMAAEAALKVLAYALRR